MKKQTWGGARKGSGRPPKEPTKTLSYRVPISKATKIDKLIKTLILSQQLPG